MNEEPSVTEAELARVATPRTDAFIDEMHKRHRAFNYDDFDHYYHATGELSKELRTMERELAAARAAIKVAREPWEKLKTLYPNSPHIIHIADAALAQLNTHTHE